MFKQTSHLCQGAGIGLRPNHYASLLNTLPAIPWVETLADNYLAPGGVKLKHLEEIRAHYPMSLHCTGLSIGSTDPLNLNYIQKIKKLKNRLRPTMISDHLCWTAKEGRNLHDLMPLPHNNEAVEHCARRILQIQDIFQERILIENVSRYIDYKHSIMPEWAFLNAVAQAADCYILLDINNIYVNARNHQLSAKEYINHIDKTRVKQYHLGGFLDEGSHLLDAHNAAVSRDVWELFTFANQVIGAVPTIIEWDSDIPSLETLFAEASTAQTIMDAHTHELECITTAAM